MTSFSKRRFLGQLATAAGSGLLYTHGFSLRAAQGASRTVASELWSVGAGQIRVSKGPWAAAENISPGVRFESLYLRQPDGVRLDALLCLPESVHTGDKVPAIITTDPYVREPVGGGIRDLDGLARSGFAAMYVHVRGTGMSEGIPSDEYAPDENADTALCIEWLSKQAWSNGNVGMMGQSYSAFNSIWVAAALKPPALKALFTWAGTDDRYLDNIYYPGGVMPMTSFDWPLGMIADLATPGAPKYVMNDKAAMDRWNTPPWLLGMLRNQFDDPYWRNSSLAPNYGQLQIPTFLASGYLDPYTDYVTKIMKNSPATTMGILGPYHHSRSPGPALDWDALRVRWFNHWLKGQDTGMLREPRVSFYMPTWRRQTYRDRGPVPGEWRFLNEWPETAFNPPTRLFFRPDPELPITRALDAEPEAGRGGALGEMAGPASALKLRYQPGTGGTDTASYISEENGYYGIDSRGDDVYGLCFDTLPLREPVEILGMAQARLFVASTAPVANWIVRIQDVAPDGTSYMITRGFLNGAHRKSHVNPEPLVPGEAYELNVELKTAGYTFGRGHRIRVVVSNACFPVAWPSPYPMVTTLFTGADRPSHIALPVLPKLPYLSGRLPLLGDELNTAAAPREASGPTYALTRDFASGVTTVTIGGISREPEMIFRVNEANPADASIHCAAKNSHRAEDGRTIETRAEGTLSSDAENFILDMKSTLLENDKVVRTRRWKDKVPRRFV